MRAQISTRINTETKSAGLLWLIAMLLAGNGVSVSSGRAGPGELRLCE